MKKQKNLVKKIPLILGLVAAVVVIVFATVKIIEAVKLSKFMATIPTAEEVSQMEVQAYEDGTIVFSGPMNSYNIAILSETTDVRTLMKYRSVGNRSGLDTVIIPKDSERMREIISEVLKAKCFIANLYVPSDMDKTVVDGWMAVEFTPVFNCKYVKGKEYALHGECAVFFHSGKDALSMSFCHGNNTFLYSLEDKVGSFFSKKEVTASFMPYEQLIASNVLSQYCFFDADVASISEEELREKTFQYDADFTGSRVYGFSDGLEVMFDVTFTATGRISGEK